MVFRLTGDDTQIYLTKDNKSTVSRELRRGLWFASNENGSYRVF